MGKRFKSPNKSEAQEKAMASLVCDQKNEPSKENKRLESGPDMHKSHSSP
jgi:hypothetical protein